mmetsp:Transcript_24550/g.50399  ORF Transcript_24550/g.50399 Transcript_24550/m.50399 type:complete len:96 (-) Transcript_24550:94-381(-)
MASLVGMVDAADGVLERDAPASSRGSALGGHVLGAAEVDSRFNDEAMSRVYSNSFVVRGSSAQGKTDAATTPSNMSTSEAAAQNLGPCWFDGTKF